MMKQYDTFGMNSNLMSKNYIFKTASKPSELIYGYQTDDKPYNACNFY